MWKDTIEFDGYECSSEERIRNKTTIKLLKPSECWMENELLNDM